MVFTLGHSNTTLSCIIFTMHVLYNEKDWWGKFGEFGESSMIRLTKAI